MYFNCRSLPYLLFLLALPLLAIAQVGPQAAKLPACISACDPAAIASVNCTNADQYCHCVRQTGILYNITACADKTCVNPSASLYTFTTLFQEVCAQFNMSVPTIGSNSSANGTIIVPQAPSTSVAPFTGSASKHSSVRVTDLTVLASIVVIGMVLSS